MRPSPSVETQVPQQSTLSPLDPISPWPPTETDITPTVSELPSAKEVYGSLAVLLTYAAFAVYLIWAFAPPHWLDMIGWTWYPSRDWALIIPCYSMVIVLLTYWSYAALSAFITPAFDSPQLITDDHANIPPVQPETHEMYYWKFERPDAVPEAVDLPIDLVNRVLYPPRRRPRDH